MNTKYFGGVGIIDTRLMNEALIGKWGGGY